MWSVIRFIIKAVGGMLIGQGVLAACHWKGWRPELWLVNMLGLDPEAWWWVLSSLAGFTLLLADRWWPLARDLIVKPVRKDSANLAARLAVHDRLLGLYTEGKQLASEYSTSTLNEVTPMMRDWSSRVVGYMRSEGFAEGDIFDFDNAEGDTYSSYLPWHKRRLTILHGIITRHSGDLYDR